jgi:uncharacterized membrane protein
MKKIVGYFIQQYLYTDTKLLTEEKMARLNLSILSGGILFIAGLRFLMAPYPNIEPIMLFTIVSALSYGPLAGFLIGFGSMLVSDLFIGLAGPWTIYTTLTYGFVGLSVGFLGIRKKEWGRAGLTAVTFVMVILYDLITATFFAFEFMVPWNAAIASQIPFTLLHLSNCVFVFLFAPYLMRAFSAMRDFSIVGVLRKFRFYA